MAVLLGKEQGFLLHGHTGVDLAENRQGSAAVTKDARFDGVLAIHHIILAVAEADLRFIRNISKHYNFASLHHLYVTFISFTRLP